MARGEALKKKTADPAVVCALVQTRTLAANLRRGVGDAASVEYQLDVPTHLTSLARVSVRLSVVEVSRQATFEPATAILVIRAQFPTLPLLGYVSAGRDISDLMVRAIRAGATGLAVEGTDDSWLVVEQALADTLANSIGDHIYSRLAPHLSLHGRQLLLYLVDHLSKKISVARAASDLNVDRKTLNNWLHESNAPTAQEFFGWIRVAAAAELLRSSGRTVEQVALDLDFGSGAALRNLVRRYVHMSIRELRSIGLEEVLRRLTEPMASGQDIPN